MDEVNRVCVHAKQWQPAGLSKGRKNTFWNTNLEMVLAQNWFIKIIKKQNNLSLFLDNNLTVPNK